MLKYLIIGIIIFILFNSIEGFSIGAQVCNMNKDSCNESSNCYWSDYKNKCFIDLRNLDKIFVMRKEKGSCDQLDQDDIEGTSCDQFYEERLKYRTCRTDSPPLPFDWENSIDNCDNYSIDKEPSFNLCENNDIGPRKAPIWPCRSDESNLAIISDVHDSDIIKNIKQIFEKGSVCAGSIINVYTLVPTFENFYQTYFVPYVFNVNLLPGIKRQLQGLVYSAQANALGLGGFNSLKTYEALLNYINFGNGHPDQNKRLNNVLSEATYSDRIRVYIILVIANLIVNIPGFNDILINRGYQIYLA